MQRLERYALKVAQETQALRRPALTYEKSDTVYDTRIERKLFGLSKKVSKVPRTVTTNVEILGPHWVLDRRDYHKRSVVITQDRRIEEEYDEWDYVALLVTGELRFATKIESITTTSSSSQPTFYREDNRGSARKLRESDVLDLDFSRPPFDRTSRSRGTETSVWGDQVARGRLIHHAKGVGLSLALKRLLGESRT